MDSRFFIIPLILIMLAVVEVDNRNHLHRKLSDEDLKEYHSCFYPLIFCAVAFIVFMFLFPSHNKEYQELQEKYEELSTSVELSYDEAVNVKAYFLGWEESSFDNAKESMHYIYDHLYPGEW